MAATNPNRETSPSDGERLLTANPREKPDGWSKEGTLAGRLGEPRVTHLWKWCQRCPWAGCSCVSACEEGCMYHSSVHSPMDWWAACKSRRRSGWVPGAVGAKDKHKVSPQVKTASHPWAWTCQPSEAERSSNKMRFKFQIPGPRCKDLFRSPGKQALYGPALDPFWSKSQHGQLLVLFHTCWVSRSLHPDADGGVTPLSLSAALIYSHVKGRCLLPFATRDRASILPRTWCCS